MNIFFFENCSSQNGPLFGSHPYTRCYTKSKHDLFFKNKKKNTTNAKILIIKDLFTKIIITKRKLEVADRRKE